MKRFRRRNQAVIRRIRKRDPKENNASHPQQDVHQDDGIRKSQFQEKWVKYSVGYYHIYQNLLEVSRRPHQEARLQGHRNQWK